MGGESSKHLAWTSQKDEKERNRFDKKNIFTSYSSVALSNQWLHCAGPESLNLFDKVCYEKNFKQACFSNCQKQVIYGPANRIPCGV